jgi:hypothetical protein
LPHGPRPDRIGKVSLTRDTIQPKPRHPHRTNFDGQGEINRTGGGASIGATVTTKEYVFLCQAAYERLTQRKLSRNWPIDDETKALDGLGSLIHEVGLAITKGVMNNDQGQFFDAIAILDELRSLLYEEARA